MFSIPGARYYKQTRFLSSDMFPTQSRRPAAKTLPNNFAIRRGSGTRERRCRFQHATPLRVSGYLTQTAASKTAAPAGTYFRTRRKPSTVPQQERVRTCRPIGVKTPRTHLSVGEDVLHVVEKEQLSQGRSGQGCLRHESRRARREGGTVGAILNINSLRLTIHKYADELIQMSCL